MADMMIFPDTVEEFMEQYKITDTEQIYTNGAELVPIFRMRQWFDHKPERDIPIKPIETTDTAWGIPNRQAVCPKCDCYLGHVAFLGDYKGKKITYCETCGQAIDWEGWDFDE